MRRHPLLVLVLASVLAAACRDGEGEGPLSKGEYVDEANEICAESKNRAAAIAPPSLADPIAVEQAVAQVVLIQREALDDLRDLEPPEIDEPGVQEWLRLIDQTIDQMERVRQGIRAGDRAAIEDANVEASGLSSEAEEFALAYGIVECATEADEQPR